jgi:tetratricopeptide (TPR) repeat protein
MDVYGLTATLYHLLTGQPPYRGEPAEVLARLLTELPPRPAALRPDLPRDLQAILEKGMEREPRHRYAEIAHLEADLRAFLEHRPVSVRPLSRGARAWRHIRRSPLRAVSVASLAVAAVAVAVAAPIWAADAARERQRAKRELMATLPSLLAVEGDPQQRLLAELRPELDEGLELLDRILELDPRDLPIRLMRAALLLDRGLGQRAAADLQLLAEQTGSPYVRAVAVRYLAAAPAAHGAHTIPLEDLPEPGTDEECFIAGFHELRNRHLEGYAFRAESLLQRAAAQGYLPARDLRLIALLACGQEEPDRDRRAFWFQQAHAESLKLEGLYGYPTARTLAVRGAALLAEKKYAEAVEPLLASLRLRPDRHGPHTNLGVAYRRLGQPELAIEHLEQASRVGPHFWNTTYTLAQVHLDRSDFAAARACAERLPAEVGWKRHELLANIARQEAVALLAQDPAAGRAAASLAIAEYDRALGLAPSESIAQGLAGARGLAAALHAGDQRTAALRFLETARPDPDSAPQIANLAALLPMDGIEPELAWRLKLFLRAYAHELGSGDVRFREEQLQHYQQLLREPPR